MLRLQEKGCHNINLVTPTHVLPQILQALYLAMKQGLSLPLVYNTSGYELPETLSMIHGVVDIYLADMRYDDPEKALRFSEAADYPQWNRLAVKEMHRQVGILCQNEDEIATQGLIVRHLVLPEGISGFQGIARFLAREISTQTHVSLMGQYAPYYLAPKIPELSRPLHSEEYDEAYDCLRKEGLYQGWVQDLGCSEDLAGVNIPETH